MGGDLTKHNHILYHQYHQDQGHTIKDCKNLRNYLEQLVKIGKLRQFLYHHLYKGVKLGRRISETTPRNHH